MAMALMMITIRLQSNFAIRWATNRLGTAEQLRRAIAIVAQTVSTYSSITSCINAWAVIMAFIAIPAPPERITVAFPRSAMLSR